MAHPRRTSSDDNHGPAALAPPRPFFLADVQTNRSSNSSFDTTSLDPASDSDSPPELPTKPAPASRLPTTGVAAPYPSRTHRKRSSMSHAVYAPLASSDKERDRDEAPGDAPKPKPPSRQNSATWDPASLYSDLQAAAALSSSPTPALFQRTSTRPPPSSFTFPFQAYPGNPDPGLSIPGVSRRRASFDSANGQDVSVGSVSQTGSNTSAMGGEVYHPLALSSSRSGSLTDLRKPVAPFMNAGDRDSASSTGSLPRSASSNSFYKASAAANMMPAAVSPGMQEPTTPVTSTIPRNASTHSFRAPFLAPSSRPTSSLWSPPSYNTQLVLNNVAPASQPLMSPNASTTALPTTPMFPSSYPHPHALKTAKPLLPSTRLPAPLTKSDKPWLEKTERGARGSYALTLLFVCLGLGAAGVFCWRGVEDVRGRMLDESNLCLVLDEQFTRGGGGVGGLDESLWTRDVELGGFGNGQFEMTTESAENLYVRDGELWFVPTLTSDSVNNILDGGSYTLPGCTGTVAPVVHTNSTNSTTSSSSNSSSNGGTNACTAFSSAARGTAINPVMSARINTKGKKSVRFGRVEVRAKLARGDWLWPAIWMLPEDDAYGPWPASGVIDIMEARGNGIEYGAQGANYVRSGLSYGPLPTVVNQIYGWWSSKRTPYSDKFHTYTLEWDPKFIRVYVDKRTSAMLEVEIGRGRRRSFWDKAGFPLTAPNGSSQVVVTNPYSTNSDSNPDGGTDAAPYDQKFYLVMNLAVGGTSGWFPDGVGGKPWFDESLTAMRDFARAQDEWSRTWPTNVEDRAFRVDYVKMWERC